MATLPGNSSSTDWENIKYLINHFDNSSMSIS